jgi:peptidyl-tRNA hydrolase, PTH1 family
MWFEKIIHPSFGKEKDTAGTYLLIGLGNPGREYRNTRHNVGFMAADRIGESLGIRIMRIQSKALTGTGRLNGFRVILIKPQTYMNLSGDAVASLIRFYKIPLAQMLVMHDDLDLPLGTLRLRPGGGSAGQKGLGSIIQKLGTQDFPRLRIGIGRPPGQMEAANFVLQEFERFDHEVLTAVLDRAVQAARSFIQQGLEVAMNQFNGGPDKG